MALYGLTDADREDLRRRARKQDAAGRGIAPRHKRRRVVGSGGGIGEHYQLIRGSTQDEVDSADPWFFLQSIQTLEQFAREPESPVRVFNSPRLFLSEGARVVAAYNQGCYTLEGLDLEGDLTTRTDADTGVVTLDAPDDAVTVGRLANLTWSSGGGGERTGMSITAVTGADVSLTGGEGDNLPADESSVDVEFVEETVDWEAVFADRPYRSEYFILLGDTIPAGTATEPGILWPATPGIYVYTPDGYVALTVENIFGQDGTIGIYNPHPYSVIGSSGAGNTRYLAVEFQHVSFDGEDITYWFSLTSDDLRGRSGWDAGDDQVLVHASGDMPAWVNAGSFVGGGGDPFDPSAIEGRLDTLEAKTIAGGYATELVVSGATTTIHHNAITADAGTQLTGINVDEFQMRMHYSGANSRDDDRWLSIADYDGTDKIQLPGHEDGDWNFRTQSEWLKTADDYDAGAAGEMQFVIHFQPGTATPFWKTATDYDPEEKQLLVNNHNTWEWQNRAAALTPEGEEDGTVQIKSVESVEVSFDSAGVLKVKINYKIFNVFGYEGTTGDVNDTLEIYNVGTAVTEVNCSGGEVVGTTGDVLTPP